MRIHALLPRSLSNGPGWRAVIWVQGCNLHCPGCFNPETWDEALGFEMTPARLAAWALGIPEIEGITWTGGEPLRQETSLAETCSRIRKHAPHLSIIVFTGLSGEPVGLAAKRLAGLVDVLIAGPYSGWEDLTWLEMDKELIFLSPRYSEKDFGGIPEFEAIISDRVIETGIARKE